MASLGKPQPPSTNTDIRLRTLVLDTELVELVGKLGSRPLCLIQQGCNKSWPIDTEALYPCDAKG